MTQKSSATNWVKQEATMDALSWDGTISSHDFYVAVHAFAQRWRKSSPAFRPWTWVPSPKRHPILASNRISIDGYLTLERLCLTDSTEKHMLSQEDSYEVTEVGKEETTFLEKEEPVDNATLVESHSFGAHYYDFHIVYSASYRVPVLFFRAYKIDGQPLVLDEIEKDLPASSAKVLLESKWTFITQEDHPYLNRPWYKLHPCGTSEWMKLLFQSDTSMANNGVAIKLYIVSWLSVVGQVFGLRVPSELLTNQD